jgi:hypothetical protein
MLEGTRGHGAGKAISDSARCGGGVGGCLGGDFMSHASGTETGNIKALGFDDMHGIGSLLSQFLDCVNLVLRQGSHDGHASSPRRPEKPHIQDRLGLRP